MRYETVKIPSRTARSSIDTSSLNWIEFIRMRGVKSENSNLRLIVLNAGVAWSIDLDEHTIHHRHQLNYQYMDSLVCVFGKKGHNSNWHLHHVHSPFQPINDFQFVRSTAEPKLTGETINWSRTNSDSFNYRSESNENNAKTNNARSSQSHIICVLCFDCAVYCFEFGRWLFSAFRSHLICCLCCCLFRFEYIKIKSILPIVLFSVSWTYVSVFPIFLINRCSSALEKRK